MIANVPNARRLISGFLFASLLAMVPAAGMAKTAQPAGAFANETVQTLINFVNLRSGLKKDIENLKSRIAGAQSEAERISLVQELGKLEVDLATVTRNFETVATGVDTTKLQIEKEQEFDFQKEVFALLRPAIDEMKEMTAHVRQKADLREKIAYYRERLPIIQQAINNLGQLSTQSEDEALKASIATLMSNWQKQLAFMDSELQAAQLQLDKLTMSETSLAEASQSYLKSFFQKRGLYLIEAAIVVFAIVLISRLSLTALRRHVSGFRQPHRGFRIRLLELFHRILTAIAVVIGPMIVFYVVEDWVLFSVGLLLLIGAALTLRSTLPRYWKQVQIFLNVGAVREGERLFLDGIPWLVEEINIFCTLDNPTADIRQRLHIQELGNLKSRPCKSDEPWFPCRKGDWVILNDGVRGKVVGISPELVQLVERGGSRVTYLMGDFLAKSPRNLATSFRIKEVLGISYGLQKDSTDSIISTLQSYVQSRLDEEGYADRLLNLRVEFNRAGESSLELVVIADFKGELADLYNRLRRAIQRYCVDACTEYGWEIPFPQLTLHGALQKA
ncbi:MAG: hypothetical protein LJE59_06020 [Chromatiaceae bacterium]|nr:hypothetical protein [Chromatiaceae bacterium]